MTGIAADTSGPATAATVLELAGAGFDYHDADRAGSNSALTGIDLHIARGEMVAVLGPQESGTSTLCRLASGLLTDRGRANGTVRTPVTVAMLGDDPEAQLTSMATYARDEVRLPGRLNAGRSGDLRTADATADDAMARLNISHLGGRRLDTLSGGERQTVALAALLTLSPELLVLDQPSLSLDGPARSRLLRALRSYCAAGGAVLITGHQHDELSAAADKRFFLDGGRLGGDGSGVWNTLSPAPGDTVDPAESKAKRPAVLQVTELSVGREETTVLHDVAFHVASGEVVSLLGPNGAGKSTLLLALAGLLERKARVSGTLLATGRAADLGSGGDTAAAREFRREFRLDGLPAHVRAGFLAWVGQDPGAQLSAPTVVLELQRAAPLPRVRKLNRRARRAERDHHVQRLLQAFDLGSVANVHPFDLPPDRRKDLVIAAALLVRPQLLLLDEPTLGRDADGIARLDRIIAGFTSAGGAVLTTTHDTRWARWVSDRTLGLRGGTISQG